MSRRPSPNGSTPSIMPGPSVITVAPESPGAHWKIDFAPKGTITNRDPAESQVMPLGPGLSANVSATVAFRFSMRKTWSGPGCAIPPLPSSATPMSVR